MVELLTYLSVPVLCIGPSVLAGTLYGRSIDEQGRGFGIGLLVGVAVSIGFVVVLEMMGIPFLIVLFLICLAYEEPTRHILLIYGGSQAVGVLWTVYWTGRDH